MNSKVIVRSVERTSSGTVSKVSDIPPAFLNDYFGMHFCLHPAIKPVIPGLRFCGTAITVQGADLDLRKMAVDLAQPGDVLVIGALGNTRFACFGAATARRGRFIEDYKIAYDGWTRDLARLRDLGLPVFAIGATPRNFSYPFGAEHGGVNVPVNCGGAQISPGDLVSGEDDGVVSLPRDTIEEHFGATLEAYQSVELRHSQGEKELYGVEAKLLEAGYRFE